MNNRTLNYGTILNKKYRIDGILGEGGFGITYLATDTLINEFVAIKEYFPSNLASRDASDENTTDITIITGNDIVNYENGLSKFEEEAANLAKFQNVDGIVKVKNFFRENNTGYMVMEYIDGISLSEYLKSVGGKLEYSQVLSMMKPIMNALSQVHKAGIIHRDISPDNIMVTKDNQLKLIDFGAARFVGNEDEKSLTIMLKEGYAPPEQYRTDGKQGPWTDVYALCATMYRMITGQVPVDSVSRVLDKDNLKPICKFTNIPKYVEKTIMKGMETAYRKRISTIEELKNEIDNINYTIKKITFISSFILLFSILVIISTKKIIIPKDLNMSSHEEFSMIYSETDNVETIIEYENKTTEISETILPEYYTQFHNICVEQYSNMNMNRYFVDLNNDAISEMIVVYIYTDSFENYMDYYIGLDIWSVVDNTCVKTFSDCQIKNYDRGFDYYLCSDKGNVFLIKNNWESVYNNTTSFYNHISIDVLYYDVKNKNYKFSLTDNYQIEDLLQKSLLIYSSSYSYTCSYDEISKTFSNDYVLNEVRAINEVLLIANEKNINVLDFEIIYDNNISGIFLTTALYNNLNDNIYNDIASVLFYDYNKITNIMDLELYETKNEDYNSRWLHSFEKFRYGKWQHYYVTLYGVGYEIQYKFGYEDGQAFVIENNELFTKDDDGKVVINSSINTVIKENARIDVFYVNNEYVEFGCKKISTINDINNYTEIIEQIETAIKGTEYIDNIYEAIRTKFDEIHFEQILKSDVGYYYINFFTYNLLDLEYSNEMRKYYGHAILHDENGKLVFDNLCWQKRNVRQIVSMPLYFVDEPIIESCKSEYELRDILYTTCTDSYVSEYLYDDFNLDYKFEMFAYLKDNSFKDSNYQESENSPSIWYTDGTNTQILMNLSPDYEFKDIYFDYLYEKPCCVIEREDKQGNLEKIFCLIENNTPIVHY